MARWGPALRMARRDLLRHRIRTLLVMVLVALPVVVGVAAAEVAHNTRWDGERQARTAMGAADAEVVVTPYVRTRVRYDGESLAALPAAFTRSGTGRLVPLRRDRADVELRSLLPAGSRITPAPDTRDIGLASGGVMHVRFLDVGDPMTVGLAALASGAAPARADEVAVNAPAADELGMLAGDGALRPDATLRLLDGTRLHVVSVLEANTDVGYDSGVAAIAPPTSRLRAQGPANHFLVDLPASAGTAPRALVASLARQGVAMRPRDVVLHPAAWGVPAPEPSPVDATAVALGAVVVLFGLVEVVLIVGSALAVGARRQVRDLGLLAASGGGPSDVRRVLLAQGLVLGVGASVVGAAAGIVVFHLGVPIYQAVSQTTVWTREIDWLAVGAVTLLGSLTGLAAALVPAWSIGRLTPVGALSGRFPVRPGESRAHRPAFVLAAVGIVVLALGGWWTAREYAPLPATMPEREMFAHQPSPLPVALGGLGLLLLVAGVVWSAPYVVRRVAGLGRLLPLSGRFAFRDAARHRFRTAAAAIALTVTAAGAVLAGFVAQAVEATAGTDNDLPPHALMLYVEDAGSARATPQRVHRLLGTIERVVGPMTAMTADRITRRGDRGGELGIPVGDGASLAVTAVDERTLRQLVGPHADAALREFRTGGLVTTDPSRVRHGTVTAVMMPGASRARNRFTLPVRAVRPSTGVDRGQLGGAWVSRATVARLGLISSPNAIQVLARRQVTPDDLARLSVYGIDAWSPEADLAPLRWVRLGVLGATGLLTLLVAGISVALAGAEGGADLATMTAVGAGPWRRRSLGAMHGLLIGLVGALLGLVVGLPAGASLVQVDGVPGVPVPWLTAGAVLLAVPLTGWCAGWLTTTTRLPLLRRSG